MTTFALAKPNRRNLSIFRKDTDMHAIDHRFAEALERQALLRSIREADRAAMRSARSIRHRIGASIIAIGRRIGGDSATTPAWQG